MKVGRATLENVNHVLRELKKLIEHVKLASVALPRPATGVGGLKWEDFKPLIQKHLSDVGIPVIAADEKL